VEERLGYELKRTQQALRAAMDAELSPMGLTTPQYAALTILEQEPGISSAELARRSFVSPQTMAGVVTNLERAGLAERRPHPSHGRVLETVLTPRAARLLTEAHRRVLAVEDRMVSGLPADVRGQLVEWLRQCTAALG
jgi:DNA-binding MarR family transcriptional regulator